MGDALCVWRMREGHSTSWCGAWKGGPMHTSAGDMLHALAQGKQIRACAACVREIRETLDKAVANE